MTKFTATLLVIVFSSALSYTSAKDAVYSLKDDSPITNDDIDNTVKIENQKRQSSISTTQYDVYEKIENSPRVSEYNQNNLGFAITFDETSQYKIKSSVSEFKGETIKLLIVSDPVMNGPDSVYIANTSNNLGGLYSLDGAHAFEMPLVESSNQSRFMERGAEYKAIIKMGIGSETMEKQCIFSINKSIKSGSWIVLKWPDEWKPLGHTSYSKPSQPRLAVEFASIVGGDCLEFVRMPLREHP